ncbi:helix-turn-helix transcriptional regulator [Escherichia coli]|uniref:helix-turn-helix transcriptional regulator n=1 Tax=Escherichia coli TaxID=562 RepID=UPI0021047047|nr:AlpA family phage regulatory protein [Escherichia coli]MCQ1820681.1 AlpA family phage regulatory protein [Escherichia coli]
MAARSQASERQVQKLIKLPRVIEITGKSRARIYDDIKSDAFPKPIKIGPRAVAWIEEEIIDWIEERKQQRFQA